MRIESPVSSAPGAAIEGANSVPKRYLETTRRDWFTTIGLELTGFATLAIGVWLFGEWGLLVLPIGLLALIRWHSRRSAYRCPACGHEFEVPMLVDLISPHGVYRSSDDTLRGWKLLRCPRCRQRGRATILRVERDI